MSAILIVDDDGAILRLVEQALDQEGYEVYKAHSGPEALAVLESVKPDLFLLDLGLPNMDGVALCRQIRTNPDVANAPIIFLTGQNAGYSVAEALESGGDDYIRKPFAVRELSARIRAHLRRSNNFVMDNIPGLRIVPGTFQVFVDSREVILTRIEFDLLNYLCNAPHKWHSTQDLLTGVWNYPEGVGDAALVRNHVRNLRRKLEHNPDHPAIIQSRHGRGYSIRAQIEFVDHQDMNI
jgi:DNA-binding response OmpR family regulator